MQRRKWRPGRQTPRVKGGKVQKKHRWDYYVKEYDVQPVDGELPIVREPAARGARHVVTERDLRTFISLIPTWDTLSVGLRGLVLGDGDDDCYGWHDLGVICIHAWPKELAAKWNQDGFEEHRLILDRLMVSYEPAEDSDGMVCHFDEKSAAAFLLMHVFLHELGHHHDRMQTRGQRHAPGGEGFAEDFANSLADRMWHDFFRAFHY